MDMKRGKYAAIADLVSQKRQQATNPKRGTMDNAKLKQALFDISVFIYRLENGKIEITPFSALLFANSAKEIVEMMIEESKQVQLLNSEPKGAA